MTADRSSGHSRFSDPVYVARYVEGPPQLVPGFADLHRMANLLLAERAPHDARLLVIGAGGGLELKAFAEEHPHWMFDGVDPAVEMLDLARHTLGPLAARVQLHAGTIDAAPPGPFDGATCLLTFHFLDEPQRRHTLAQIHHRLKPGAPFIAVHVSLPAGDDLRTRWLAHYAAFAKRPPAAVKAAAPPQAIPSGVTILTPEQDEALLHEAGFSDVSLFYAGLILRGWVTYA